MPRNISGIVLLDKPPGLSSNQALQHAKRLFRAAKAGHTGSLDPFATGMLPLCFGEATKISNFLLDATKRYATRVRLGVQTDTGDPEGKIIERAAVPELAREDIEEALRAFTGDIQQVPPMYSALKKDGKRLYQLARDGEEVVRAPRPVTIHQLQLTDSGSDWLDLDVVCSKGTYIRVLAEDIGRGLGTVAHAESLRRTAVGAFGGLMHTVDHLERLAEQGTEALDALLIAPDAALTDIPALQLEAEQLPRVRHGNPVTVDAPGHRGLVRIYSDQGEFLGVGEVTADNQLAPKRLMVQR